MNYFEFFDIPASMEIDLKVLKLKFYANSKKYHPDFFTLEGIDKQTAALEMSTINNQAYHTLKDFDKRLKYVLDLHDILEEEGNNKISQDFLMEMMDVNEEVMELQFDFDEQKMKEILIQIETKKEKIKSKVSNLLVKKLKEINKAEFELLKNYYLKSKYLLRLSENINNFKA